MYSIDFIYVVYKNIDFLKISIDELIGKFSDNFDKINIIIVDNSYTISSKNEINNFLEFLKIYEIKDKINIKYVPSDFNLGFARACNKGAYLSNSDKIIFLNCDTRFNITSRESFVKSIDLCCYECPIVGLKICNKYGKFSDSSFTFDPLYILTKPLNHFDCFSKFLNKYRILNFNNNVKVEDLNLNSVLKVDWISGCFMVIDRSFFNEIGGFDERYFMYFEDVDICRKVKEKKAKVLYDTNTKVIHYAQLESKKYKSIIKSFLLNKTARYHFLSWLKYIFKWRKDFLINPFRKL